MKTYIKSIGFSILCAITLSCNTTTNPGGNIIKHKYNNNQKRATNKTKQVNDSIWNYLSSSTNKDSIDANKGFLSTKEPLVIHKNNDITNDAIVYDMTQYDFLNEHPEGAPKTTNPSLWRQSRLNRINGLFEVKEGAIYQIRGFDLANMSLIKRKDGNWIVVDPLGSPETAKAGLKLADSTLQANGIITGDLKVSAVIFTHSHLDHFGGINGVKDYYTEGVKFYGPEGFFEEAVSENVMAGNTMGRRASYMYGNVLEKNEKGTLGTGLGQTTATGLAGIVEVIEINKDNANRYVEDLGIRFMMTPGAEAPAEFVFYIPKYKAFCQAEEINHTLHNLYTLRGAKVRNGQKWSQYIDDIIKEWGDDVEYSFGSHHWPKWNEESDDEIKIFWENQRDLYRFIHDQTLRMANTGMTPLEIANTLKLPKNIDTKFENRGYYGTVSHNARAQYQLYFGWFDGNPANLNKHTPHEAGKRYVEYMGGIAKILEKAEVTYREGDYRFVAEVLNHVIFSGTIDKSLNNDYIKAKQLLADAYEQLGYQSESGPWRNFYLSGAKELRGEVGGASLVTASPDMIDGMPNDLLFNYLAMRFNGMDEDAQLMNKKILVRFLYDDTKERKIIGINEDKHVLLIIQNGVVTPRHLSDREANKIAENVDEIVEMTNDKFKEKIVEVLSAKTEEEKDNILKEIAKLHPNSAEFLGYLDDFEFWFNIVTP